MNRFRTAAIGRLCVPRRAIRQRGIALRTFPARPPETPGRLDSHSGYFGASTIII